MRYIQSSIKTVIVSIFLLSLSFITAGRQQSMNLFKSVDVPNKQIYVIAGNFSLNGEMLNFAEYDVASDKWIRKYQAELSSVESHGVILDVVCNKTSDSRPDRLFVVGTFDTMTSTSQMQFCSVGAWNGIAFEKVGEGLCPRGNVAAAMVSRILAITLGNNGDLFVGGSFESRMWDGKKFINIQHLARYYGPTSSWLPLAEGSLTTLQAAKSTNVKALAWDSVNEILYIGGEFDSIEYTPLSIGLALWRHDVGLVPFPTPGVYVDDNQNAGGTVYNILYEDESESLFVAGNFRWIGGIFCQSIAVWHRLSNSWTCLFESIRGISTVTALSLNQHTLYMAGWAAPSSDWNGRQWGSNYAIAFLRIDGYIKEKLQYSHNTSMNSNSSISNSHRRHLRRQKQHRASTPFNNTIISSMNYRNRQLSHDDSYQSMTIIHPTPAPSRQPLPPWIPHWQWLNGYSGGNGPIIKLVPGIDHLHGCLFIVGAFNNDQAVVIWCNNTVTGPTVTGLSPNHTILGLITSITQLSTLDDDMNPLSPVEPPTPVVVIDRSHAVLLVASFAILLAAVIGLVIFRQRQGYSPVSGTDDHETSSRDKSKVSVGLTFPLTTLSGGVDNSVDFRASFERAMQARHLPSHESLLIIDPSEVILSKAIGEGSFGRVWSGYWRNNAVAIKEFIFAQSAIVGGSVDRNNIIDEIVGEAGIMACLRHPKILQIYGCSLTMQAIWIASELCNRGSLRMVLNDKTVDLAWLKKLSLCVDVADGMLYLHTRNPPIIHRDLKSHNIFIIETSPGHLIAKIGDWGSARALALSGAKSMTQGVGTACWLAPEVINNAHFSKDSDVYAFGILLWEVYTRLEVHERLSAAQIIAKVAHEGLRPHVPRNCPWTDLMTSCWQQNNRLRPGFNKILTELSAMYSSAKANIRLQQLVDTNKLKVNPPEIELLPMEISAGRPNRVRSFPGLVETSNSMVSAEEQADLDTAARNAKFNSTPLPGTSTTTIPYPYHPISPTIRTPAIKQPVDVDMLLISSDVVTYADQSTMKPIADPSSAGLANGSSPTIYIPDADDEDESPRSRRTPRRRIPYSATNSPNRHDIRIGDPSADDNWDAGGYDTT